MKSFNKVNLSFLTREQKIMLGEFLRKRLPPEELNKPIAEGITPLYLAAEENYADIFKILAEKLPLEELNKPINGVTPLEIAMDRVM
jgi:hypothetical protein